MRVMLFFISICLVCTSGAVAKLPSYAEYLKMDMAKRESVAQKNVRKDKGHFVITPPHYDIKSTVNKEHALKMAVLMEDFYTQFASVFKGKRKNKKKPSVYIHPDREAYARSLAEYSRGRIDAGWSVGMFVHNSRGKSALFGYRKGSEDIKLQKTILHEGTHQLLNSFLGSSIPVWFNEGTATNFETWQMYRSKLQNIHTSLSVSARARGVIRYKDDGSFVPFRKLINISSKGWSATTNPGPNYASAWVSLNFFLTTKEGRKIFKQIYKRISKSKKTTGLLSPQFAEKAEKRIDEYIEQVVRPHVKYTRNIRKALGQGDVTRALDVAQQMVLEYPQNKEALFYSLWLGVKTPDAAKTALKKIEKWRKEDLSNPDVIQACAQLALRSGDTRKAQKYVKELQAADSQHKGAEELMAQIKK